LSRRQHEKFSLPVLVLPAESHGIFPPGNMRAAAHRGSHRRTGHGHGKAARRPPTTHSDHRPNAATTTRRGSRAATAPSGDMRNWPT